MERGGVCDRLPELYAWQHEAFDAWTDADRRGIVEAVTGTGKTMLGVLAVGEALAAGRRAAVIVPTQELQLQWRRTLRQHLPGRFRLGLLGGGESASLRTHDIVVAIVNSARGGRLSPPPGSLIVADECHRYASEHNRTAFHADFGDRLGLTATFERPDRLESHVVDFLGESCFTIGYAQAIADEVTAHFTVALVGVPMSRDEADQYEVLSKRLGELTSVLVERYHFPATPFHLFMRKVVEAAEDREHPANDDARAFLSVVHARRSLMATSESKIEAAAMLAPAIDAADRTLVFSDSIDTAEDVCDRLAGQGLSVETLHSEHERDYRRAVLTEFGRGELKALVAPKVLDEGIDVPAADLAVIVAGSRTRRQMVQRLGRVMRRKQDGRLARLAILFLEHTVEDPAQGGHEVFLGEALAVCEDYKVFRAKDLAGANAFLCSYESLALPGEPRRRGEVPRTVEEPKPDDAVAATEFLGVKMTPPHRTSSVGRSRPSTTRPSAPERTARRLPRARNSVTPPAPAEVVDRLRVAYKAAHTFVTANERRAFDEALPRLVALYGEKAISIGIRRSPSVELIEESASYVQKRSQEIAAAHERETRRQENQEGPPSPTERRRRSERRRRNDGSSKRTPGHNSGERPLYESNGGSTPICPACGSPETRCGC